MRLTLVSALYGLALVPSLALAQDVKTDYEHGYDFGKVKTFAVKLANPWGNPLGEKRVTEDVTQAISAKGWKAAPEGTADALVVLHGATQQKHSLNTFYDGMGGWRFGGFGTATTSVPDYTVGTLVVDIFDAKSRDLVFRGTASGELSDKPEKNVKKAEKATDKMLALRVLEWVKSNCRTRFCPLWARSTATDRS
jgi:hypothetical protein